MDYLPELGLLAIGNRLKRLGDRLGAGAAKLGRDREIAFEPRWLPLFGLLRDRGPATVGEAAAALGLSHAAISQIARAMTRHGLVASIRDSRDERRRLLSLTPEGRRLGTRMQPVWNQLAAALRELVAADEAPLLAALERLERGLDDLDLAQRVARTRPGAIPEVEILPFRREHARDFERLNREWLESDFRVEPVDAEILGDPERVVIQAGGQIFFARIGEEIVGTCALLDTHDGRFELTKMAVAREQRGQRIGRRLLRRAIDAARELGASAVFLVTNQKLEPAIALYRSAGFVVTHRGPHPKYERGDLIMELELKAPATRLRSRG